MISTMMCELVALSRALVRTPGRVRLIKETAPRMVSWTSMMARVAVRENAARLETLHRRHTSGAKRKGR